MFIKCNKWSQLDELVSTTWGKICEKVHEQKSSLQKKSGINSTNPLHHEAFTFYFMSINIYKRRLNIRCEPPKTVASPLTNQTIVINS